RRMLPGPINAIRCCRDASQNPNGCALSQRWRNWKCRKDGCRNTTAPRFTIAPTSTTPRRRFAMSETLSEQDGHSEMMVDLFTKNFWLAIGTWVVLYCLDYGLTLVGAKLYRSRGSKHYSFSEGYELNPVFKEDIARLRVFSFRFFLLLIFSSGLLAILYSANFPPAFMLAWGALVV